MTSEKNVSYNTRNTYSTLNEFKSKTRNVWLVFHGMGYLSRYFIKYFKSLNPEENYIIAPQAPSKYYQGSNFKHVGASWLTRENTIEETKNVLSYVDAVWKAEQPKFEFRFIVLGYSQGVSIATRWLSSRKIQCDELVLHSGAIPKELVPAHFDHFNTDTRVTYLYGDQDPYITEARITEQRLIGSRLFGDRLKVEVFTGAHEVCVPFINRLSTKS